MALPQAAPNRGENRRVYFHYVSTPGGCSWHGWKAGHGDWFECHKRPKCKPCLDVMTKGQVPCSCKGLRGGEVFGYAPFYRETDGRPVVVILPEVERDRFSKIPLHARCIVGREKGNGNSVYVTKALTDKPLFETTLEERRYPADLTNTLLTMWALPELTAWYQSGHNPSAAPRSSIVTPSRIITPKQELLDAAMNAGNVVEEVFKKNGVHKRG